MFYISQTRAEIKGGGEHGTIEKQWNSRKFRNFRKDRREGSEEIQHCAKEEVMKTVKTG